MSGEQIGYIIGRFLVPVLIGLAIAFAIRRTARKLPPDAARARRTVGTLVGIIAVVVLLIGGAVGAARGDDTPSWWSLQANHDGFVRGVVANCMENCTPVNGPEACTEICTCFGDEMGQRVSPEDVYDIYQREQQMSREEAMAPYLEGVLDVFAICGHPLE